MISLFVFLPISFLTPERNINTDTNALLLYSLLQYDALLHVQLNKGLDESSFQCSDLHLLHPKTNSQ